MKRRVCIGCSSAFNLKSDEYRYLHESVPFICSAKCLVTVIKGFPEISQNSLRKIQNDYFLCERLGVRTDPEIWSPQYQQFFGSHFEIELVDFLEKINEPWIREKYYFEIGHTIYVPDLYLIKRDVFIEVKGLWLNRARPKMKKFREKYPDQKFILVPYLLRNSILKYGGNGCGDSEKLDQRRVRYFPQ